MDVGENWDPTKYEYERDQIDDGASEMWNAMKLTQIDVGGE